MTKEEFVRSGSWILKVIRDRCELTQAEVDYLNCLIEVLEREKLKGDGENWLIPKRALKWRGKGCVFYNVSWFKRNWQGELERMKIDVKPSAFEERQKKTELEGRYLDGISNTIV